MDAVKLMIDEFMALSMHTLENGQTDLRQILHHRLVIITLDEILEYNFSVVASIQPFYFSVDFARGFGLQ